MSPGSYYVIFYGCRWRAQWKDPELRALAWPQVMPKLVMAGPMRHLGSQSVSLGSSESHSPGPLESRDSVPSGHYLWALPMCT